MTSRDVIVVTRQPSAALLRIEKIQVSTLVLDRKQPDRPRKGMPYRCVAGGCSRTSGNKVWDCLSAQDPRRRLRLPSKRFRTFEATWTGPSTSSQLCSLYLRVILTTAKRRIGENYFRKRFVSFRESGHRLWARYQYWRQVNFYSGAIAA